MKKIISIAVFSVVIALLAYALVPGFIDQLQSRNAVKGVLDNVIDQNYEEAFESVYFYDIASDLEPIISYEEGKKRWIQQVKELGEQGIYLVDYKKLRVDLDDTYPVGSVDLVFMENGEKKVKKGVQLWFAERDDKWKVGNFDYLYDDIEEQWEHALSGNFN